MNRRFFSTDRPNRFLNHLIYIPILYIYTYIVQEPRCSYSIILLCVYHYYVPSTQWFFFHCTASSRRPLKTLSAGTYRYTFFSLLTFLLFILYFFFFVFAHLQARAGHAINFKPFSKQSPVLSLFSNCFRGNVLRALLLLYPMIYRCICIYIYI